MIITREEKEALYNLLNAVKEKLNKDFKEDVKILRKNIA